MMLELRNVDADTSVIGTSTSTDSNSPSKDTDSITNANTAKNTHIAVTPPKNSQYSSSLNNPLHLNPLDTDAINSSSMQHQYGTMTIQVPSSPAIGLLRQSEVKIMSNLLKLAGTTLETAMIDVDDAFMLPIDAVLNAK